jgi:riboflavin kinase/FMN adenylyltransferase
MATPKIARSLEQVRVMAPRNSAVTLGVFDGVHLGHREVMKELLHARKLPGIDQCHLVTFDPHPLVVTHSKMMPPMLTTIEERIVLLSRYDLDGILVLKFDEQLAGVDYREFLDRYLVRPFDMKHFVLGYDCHFGRNREGSPDRMQREAPKLGFSVSVIPAFELGEEIISSTRIRNALIEGNLDKANALLGHPYVLSGRIVEGHGQGRQLGFPTANLMIADPFKLWPPRGVYAVRAESENRLYDGMMNIGRAPTMKTLPEEAREAEVHLFDFEGNLYGKSLFVYCYAYLRKEQEFASPAELARQLDRDRIEAIKRLGAQGVSRNRHAGGPAGSGRGDNGESGWG